MNMAATIAAAPAKTPATSSMIDSATLDPISVSRSVFAAQGLLIQLRAHHPTGCLVAELVQVVEGNYIVRALVQVEGMTIASAMAGASTIEIAEDQARSRVLSVLGIAPLNLEAPVTVPNTVPAAMRLPEIALPEMTLPVEPAVVEAAAIEPEAKLEPTTTKATRSKARKTATVEKVEPVIVPEVEVGSESVVESEPVVEPAVVAEPEPVAVLDVPPPPAFMEESVEITGGDEEIEYEFTFEGDEEPEVEAAAPVLEDPVMDLSDAIMEIGAEIDRIGWTKKQGSSYLQETYSKRTRAELTQAELLSFLNYLKSLPSKVQPALGELPF
jgi:hypothetical protein